MAIKAIGNRSAAIAINQAIHNWEIFTANSMLNQGKIKVGPYNPETQLDKKILYDEGLRLRDLPIRQDFDSIEDLKSWLATLGFDLFYSGEIMRGTGFEKNYEQILYFGHKDKVHAIIPRMFINPHKNRYDN